MPRSAEKEASELAWALESHWKNECGPLPDEFQSRVFFSEEGRRGGRSSVERRQPRRTLTIFSEVAPSF
jgi:hypothetical protein